MANKTTNPPKQEKYRVMACILYPENEQHQRILGMFERREQLYHPVYILHDRDVWVEGDELPEGVKIGDRKKPHWHVVVTHSCSMSTSAFSKFLGGVYVEGVNNKHSYMQYMLHDTPESWHKVQYDVSELHGWQPDIRKLTGKNAYFVQLKDIANDIANGDSLINI